MQPSTSERYAAAALDLLRQCGQDGATTRLSVSGTSMLPLLRPGDAVWLQPLDAAALQPGDLALVRQDGMLLTHRLIAVGSERWQTKGDNNRLADPPLTAQQILGRIGALERGGTRIDLRRRAWPSANRLLARISWLEDRCHALVHPRSKVLASMVDAPFRLLLWSIVVVAVRL